jgi:HAE1 family hydrophobic/amphiphilic exporter-1
MNFSELFIRRPIMTTLVMSALLLFGIMGYRELPVSDLPNVDFPTISVSASVPGAGPETMAAAVATPLEKAFSNIPGLDSMTSTNSLGRTRITLQFNLNRDIDAAAQDVQAMIARTVRQLPADMTSPPSYEKVNPADQPVFYLVLSSPTLPLSTVAEYADTMIGQRISMVSGVAQVQIYGLQKYAVRVQLDPTTLAARGIGLDEVSSAIERANVNLPTGALSGVTQTYTLKASGQLFNAGAYRSLVVAWRNGSPVRLGELGRVLDSVENTRTASWFKDTRSMILAISRQPGTNTIQVVDGIRKLLPTFQAQLPGSIRMDILNDRSTAIRESFADVKFTLLLAMFLVVMIIFVFLRNLSATIIPSLALPLSIVFTFSVMYLLDFSLNNLSLMALILAVGFVVDDAIVMLENIVRHLERGEAPLEASLKGSREIGFTILSMTLSLVAVFIPVFFMGGIVGRLLKEFAVTIGVAVLVSGFVSLSLTPMLCSRFLRHSPPEGHGFLYRLSGRALDAFQRGYGASLRFVLRHRLATMVFSIVLLAVTVRLFGTMPKGFLPSEDTGQLNVSTLARQGISFDSMVSHQKGVAEVIKADPNVDAWMSSIGMGSGNAGNLFIRLKPRKERRLSADQVLQELRRKTAAVIGIQTFIQNPPPINVGGHVSRGLYQFTLQSPDTDTLYRHAAILETKLRGLPDLLDVNSDLQLTNPEVTVDIDRDRAAALGVTVEQIERAMAIAYGSQQVTTIFAPTNQYKVVLEIMPEFQTDPSALDLLYVRSGAGTLIPLKTLTRQRQTVGPLQVAHQGQLPAATISFNLRPGVSLGEAVATVEKTARETLPATISTSFQGTAQAFQSSFQGLWLLLVMAILVIYIVLGVLYESFVHPLTILWGLPSAGLGALLTLMIFKLDLNVYSFVGIIMLVGIVKKNGIMMIDFALDAQRNEGKAPADAIYEGALVRFRPIMMTTMAALMGTLPIALGFGAGAESRRPLGLAVVGGLLVSQVLTLYFTPVAYLFFEKVKTGTASAVSGLFSGKNRP